MKKYTSIYTLYTTKKNTHIYMYIYKKVYMEGCTVQSVQRFSNL